MININISISEDYSKTPGGRYIKEGMFSGEHFRDTILEPSYITALNNNEKLIINLDGGYGYCAGFLEETFGGLIRKGYNPEELLNTLDFISEEEPELIEEIKKYITDSKIFKLKYNR